jgi:hypothetical protein
VLTDNDFRDTLDRLAVRHTLVRAGRPQTNDAVEALDRPMLATRLRPQPPRPLHRTQTRPRQYIDDYNFHRVHNRRLIPTDIVYGARKVKTR